MKLLLLNRNPDLLEQGISFDDMKVMALSDVGIPYIDPDLNGDYKEIIERRDNQRSKLRFVSLFPSSNKFPRYLGLSEEEIGDEKLVDKFNSYLQQMGFISLNDERIGDILNVDENLSSRDQIIQLRDNLSQVLKEMWVVFNHSC